MARKYNSFRLDSGIQVCVGWVPVGSESVSFDYPFINSDYIAIAGLSDNNFAIVPACYTKTTTGMKITTLTDSGATYTNRVMSFIAIGAWKNYITE